MPTSIRSQILAGLQEHFLDMADEVTPPVLWDTVKLDPLTPADRRKKASLSIRPGVESKRPLISAGGKGGYDCDLTVILEWYYLVDKVTETAGSTLVSENVLTEIQKWVDLANAFGKPCHNLALSILEVDNSTDVDDTKDIQVEGTLTISCRYRHKQGDPTVPR